MIVLDHHFSKERQPLSYIAVRNSMTHPEAAGCKSNAFNDADNTTDSLLTRYSLNKTHENKP